MIKKCGPIMEAVPLWDFTKTPWVHKSKDEGDAEVIAAIKMVEQFSLQFDNSKSWSLRIDASSDWQNEDIKRKVNELAEGFKNKSYQTKLDDASRVLAHSMLSNVILTSTDVHDEAKWPKICEKSLQIILKILRVPAALLDATLYQKITKEKDTKAKKSSTMSSASTTAPNSSRDTDGASASSVATEAPPPKKKFKRFGAP